MGIAFIGGEWIRVPRRPVYIMTKGVRREEVPAEVWAEMEELGWRRVSGLREGSR